MADRDRLHEAADRLDSDPNGSGSAKASRLEAHACIDALDGRIPQATSGFVAALRRQAQIGQRWEQAQCALTFLRLVGPGVPAARLAAEEAREIFESVGAKPFIERLDAELAPASTAPVRSDSAAPSPIEA